MKIFRVIFLLAIGSMMLSGCDFFRKIAGRPTSEQIEAKRLIIEGEKTRHTERLAELDSLSKELADSLNLIDSITASSSPLVASRQLTEKARMELPFRYYAIVGSFAKSANAQNAVLAAQEAGYEAVQIEYKNGLVAIGICPSNSLIDICNKLSEVKEYCPDAWILDNN